MFLPKLPLRVQRALWENFRLSMEQPRPRHVRVVPEPAPTVPLESSGRLARRRVRTVKVASTPLRQAQQPRPHAWIAHSENIRNLAAATWNETVTYHAPPDPLFVMPLLVSVTMVATSCAPMMTRVHKKTDALLEILQRRSVQHVLWESTQQKEKQRRAVPVVQRDAILWKKEQHRPNRA